MRERDKKSLIWSSHMQPTWLPSAFYLTALSLSLSLDFFFQSNSMKREAKKIPAPPPRRPILGGGGGGGANPKAPPARPRRSVNPAKKAEDLQRNLEEKEKFTKELQSEILSLKAELERFRILNIELELEKIQLGKELSEARQKEEECRVRLERENTRENEKKVSPPLPPPPPPPLPPPKSGKGKKLNSVVETFKSLSKHDGDDARVSIVGELQNRSALQLAIKSDVEKKGSFVLVLIERIRSADFQDMDQVVAFVEWLDLQLSTLADERAVLKHFEWPEKKADAMREAAVEYADLKRLMEEIDSFRDHQSLPSEDAFKKITLLFDKLERRLERVSRLRENASRSYREMRIPTDWMLDSGEMISKLKLTASTKLANAFLRRAQLESAHEALLRGLAFAFRVYQVVGGLDRKTMETFEELRQRTKPS